MFATWYVANKWDVRRYQPFPQFPPWSCAGYYSCVLISLGLFVMVSTEFEKWALGYAGCDGGDIGSPEHPSVWVCGIEWGGGHDPESLRKHMQEESDDPPNGYLSWNENLSYIFNWQVVKLLAAISGNQVSNYKEFAENVKPFVDGFSGYFKMNLYPIAFRNTSHVNWLGGFSEITGFTSKNEYLAWCNEKRLPNICRWAQNNLPELVICLGKTFRSEFGTAFSIQADSWNTETIDDKDLSWAINESGTLVAVLPFMVNRNGLVRNASIQKFGERIAGLQSDIKSRIRPTATSVHHC